MTLTNDQWQEGIVQLANNGLSPAANQRINTQAGDIAAGSAVSGAFVAGAIADLSTLPASLTELLGDTDNLVTIAPGVQGWIAATGTGTATTDDSLTFASQVRKVALYNASANPVPLEFDATSSATSFPMPPGAFWVFDNILCTVVHVFPSALLPINTTSGLYVKGWK